jgi:hypothetical protein
MVGSPTGVFILNGSFLGLAAIEWIFRFRFAVVNRNTMLMLFSIGSLLLLFRSVNLSSPSPDVLVNIITLQVIGIGITKYLKGQFQTIRGNYLLWLLSWGVACKLSLSGLLLGWILYLLFITYKKNIQPKIIIGCLLIGGIFIIRGIILSGYPLFPTQLLGLDLIWNCLSLNPQSRASASTLLNHKFFCFVMPLIYDLQHKVEFLFLHHRNHLSLNFQSLGLQIFLRF